MANTGTTPGPAEGRQPRREESHPLPRPATLPLLSRAGRGFRSRLRLLGLATLVGLVTGVGAVGFYAATHAAATLALGGIAGYRPTPRPAGEPHLPFLPESEAPLRPWVLPVLAAVGGLVSGWLVFRFAPEAEGHGTDAVIDAYHRRDGLIRPRVPAVKILASAVTLGTGGSGGREGPIAQIGAGFGSVLSGWLRLRPEERRVLTAAGMGAGVAAVFRAPLAGALFAAEVLYSGPEFESEVIIPAGIASCVSYCTYGIVFGWRPLFAVPEMEFGGPAELVGYCVLAAFMVAAASAFVRSFYGLTAAFHRLPMPRALKPAVGAGLTGLLALGLLWLSGGDPRVLSVLSFGYDSLQAAMAPDGGGAAAGMTVTLLATVALGKLVTTGLTIGSGGSGGVFGPSMVIGGCAGAAVGTVLHAHWPAVAPHPAAYAVVGMAGFFSAAAKTPFSTVVIVCEMTGGYGLLLPAMWVCVLSYLMSDRRSLYSNQVEGRANSPAHQGAFVRRAVEDLRVGQFLQAASAAPAAPDDGAAADGAAGDGMAAGGDLPARRPPPLRPSDSAEAIIARLSSAGSAGGADAAVLPVVEPAGPDGGEPRLVGVVGLEEVFAATQAASPGDLLVAADLMRTDVVPLRPQDTLDRALELFVEARLPALPVVDSLEDRRLLGVIRRFDISDAYLRRLHGRRSAAADPADPV